MVARWKEVAVAVLMGWGSGLADRGALWFLESYAVRDDYA